MAASPLNPYTEIAKRAMSAGVMQRALTYLTARGTYYVTNESPRYVPCKLSSVTAANPTVSVIDDFAVIKYTDRCGCIVDLRGAQPPEKLERAIAVSTENAAADRAEASRGALRDLWVVPTGGEPDYSVRVIPAI